MAKHRTGNKRSLNLDFEWSLRPFTLLLSCFGVPLALQSSQQHFGRVSDRYRWWMVTGFGLLLFFWHVECQFSVLAYRVFIDTSLSNELSAVFGKLTSALFWNIWIHFLNATVLALGSHWILMTYLLKNWYHVTKVLYAMKQQSFYSDQDYRKFRTTTIRGVAASMMVSSNLNNQFT